MLVVKLHGVTLGGVEISSFGCILSHRSKIQQLLISFNQVNSL